MANRGQFFIMDFKCDWLVGSQRVGPLGIWGQNGTAENDLVFTTIKHESRLSQCVYTSNLARF